MAEREDPETRWEYKIIWRSGALLLLAVGLLAMGFGASGLCTTAISAILVPIGFICLVAGVVLPRIEGKLTVGPSQISADILGIRTLDQLSVSTSAPAVVLREIQTREGLVAIEATQPPGAITLGDVWDALDAAGVNPASEAEALNNQAVLEGVGLGSAYFRLADGRTLKMPNRGFLDYGAASPELLAVLAAWGFGRQPAADTRCPLSKLAGLQLNRQCSSSHLALILMAEPSLGRQPPRSARDAAAGNGSNHIAYRYSRSACISPLTCADDRYRPSCH